MLSSDSQMKNNTNTRDYTYNITYNALKNMHIYVHIQRKTVNIKGIVHPKIKMLSLFYHHQYAVIIIIIRGQ